MAHKLLIITNRHLCKIPLEKQVQKLLEARTAIRENSREIPREPLREIPTWLREATQIGVVLREPDLGLAEYITLSKQVQKICASFADVRFIAHGAVSISEWVACQGVHVPRRHLGQSDSGGKNQGCCNVGISIHNQREWEDTRELTKVGRHQYYCFSPFFPTDCKPGVSPMGTTFTTFPKVKGIDYYALGGINETNYMYPLRLGADGVAIMGEAMKW